MRRRIFPILLIAVAGMLMAILAWTDSTVYNENGRLASGLRYWRTGDFSAFRVNPPLTSLVAALPSVILGAEHPTRAELGVKSFARDEFEAGILLMRKNPNYRILLFTGRLCNVVLLLVGFGFCFRYAVTLYSSSAGYFFIGLCLFSPCILGYGHLIGPDAAAGILGLCSVYFFWCWLRNPCAESAIVAGIALGLAELTKFTLLIFYPLFLLLWILYQFPKNEAVRPGSLRRSFKLFVFMIGLSLLTINAGYMFEGTGKQLRTYKFQTAMFSGSDTYNNVPVCGGNRFDGSGNIFETAIGYLPMPLPRNFIQGIDTQRLDFEQGKPSYLRGCWSDRGWWYYYLYAIFLKTPLGTIGLFLLAICCSFYLKECNAEWRDGSICSY